MQLLTATNPKFINHSEVEIIAGAGLTGGGDITESRTLSFDPTYSATFAGLTLTEFDGILIAEDGVVQATNILDLGLSQ